MPSRTVVARETELDRLRSFLADAEARSLVLRGEPGIGKTVLWHTAVEEARTSGCRVLMHRALEAEAALAFTGLADLIAPVLDEVSEALPEPRARALRVALLLEAPGGAPPPPQAVGLAVLDVLTALCEQGETLIAIDDLQWLDTSTAAVLPLALRRVSGERLRVLATLRDAPGVHAPFELSRVFGEDRTAEIRVGSFGLSELHHLLDERLGVELPRPRLARVHELSGGNPLYALELARAGDLRVPPSLREALDTRLARLPDDTTDVLLAAAALARPTLAAVAPDQQRQAAIELAIDAQVIELDDDIVRFTHPLLASRCYERATPWKRRQVHRELATALDDIEQRARHLALGGDGPDEAVATQLDIAVESAAARGATAAAAELAELAVELTPGDPIARRSSAAHFHHLAGDFARADELYAELARELPSGAERADVLYTRAIIGLEDLPERIRLCEQALVDAVEDDIRCAQIHGFQAISRWIHGDVRASIAEARVGLERAECAGDPKTIAVAIGRLGYLETCALEATPGLFARALDIEAGLPEPLFFQESPSFFEAVSRCVSGDLDRSRAALTEMLSNAIRSGDEHARLFMHLMLAVLERWAGHLDRSLEHAAAGREIAKQTGELQYPAMLEWAASCSEADVGYLDTARASARRAQAAADRARDEIFQISSLTALGYVEFLADNLPAAIEILRPLPQRQLRTGHRTPNCDPWVDTIEVLVALGEVDEAQRHVDQYWELPCAAHPRGRVAAGRAAGLIHAARGNRDAALTALTAAIATDPIPVFPLERGRTLVALGSVQRQAGQRRAARETLTDALTLFDSMGARPWADKARTELSRISGRGAASSDALTAAEQEVARLASEGRQNKEIAAALYVTVGTVEGHLSRVYRKLGVRSRAELAGRFTRAETANTGDPNGQ
jgi:DNA-binding CsgD family transcriptional regulator